MKWKALPVLAVLLSVLAGPASAQSGYWAQFGAAHKGNALVRDAEGGHLDEVRNIVKGGGDVNWQLEFSGLSPLMAAAGRGHLEVVSFLLENGADPNLKDRNGQTALDRARQFGRSHVVRALSGAGTTAAPQKAAPPAATPRQTARPPTAGRSRPAAAPQTPRPSTAAPTRWAPYGTYRVGDRVQFRRANGWFKGTISDVGPVGTYSPRSNELYERKYRIADDRYPGHAGDWHEWGTVAGPTREPFWTGFFVGDWRVGEVAAINKVHTRDLEITEVSFLSAPEALRVHADGTYEWKALANPLIRGRWVPAADGPGIVLLKGLRGRDWTLRNETNTSEENIRKIESGRLSAEGQLSIKALRPRADLRK